MKPQFWLDRWARNETGFHRSETNPYLARHWSSLEVPAEASVLVPLCGKSLDLLWLRDQGHDVVGVELAERAVEAVFTENAVRFSKRRAGTMWAFEADRLCVFCGDFFELDLRQLPPPAAAYDRAALIAMPPGLRERYAAHLAHLLPAGARVLLVTLEYADGEMAGPPFSVDADEVMRVHAERFEVERLELGELEPTAPRIAARGVRATRDAVYRLVRR